MEGRTRDELLEGGMRKWEDLNRDCLTNIFERVVIESLIWSLPFVCKNWYNASLEPQCWKSLDFKSVLSSKCDEKSHLDVLSFITWICKFPFLELVKFAVGRSQGIATKVVLPDIEIKFEVITYIPDSCPMLKTLVFFQSCVVLDKECISKLIRKWNYLEHLTLNCKLHFHDIISEINTHWKNFASLSTWGDITDEATTTIVTLLPNISCLNLRGSTLDRTNLVLILCECKMLEFLDVSHCLGFDSDDAEIVKMASHIGTFLAEGSVEYPINILIIYSIYYENIL